MMHDEIVPKGESMDPERGNRTVEGHAVVSEHLTHEKFYSYYAAQSQDEQTQARFRVIRDIVLRVLRRRRGVYEVVDIGCGAGTQSALWAQAGHVVHGLDISQELVELARRRATEAGFSIDFRVGTATDLPWAEASMDVCLVPELLEHVQDWRRCLDEFARILKPGGVLFLSTDNKLCPKQEEFNLPLYSWYPARFKRYCERLAVTTRPQLVNYARFPAINWFTYFGLRDELAIRRFRAMDRFDVIDLERAGTVKRLVVGAIRRFAPLRWFAHALTPYTLIVAIRS
jgi:2-polyprenyl-6-hydroxyphenyl methylase/3-demethylubiquinone-9 3-methyltransferase